jgi:hypothetical protein
VAEEKERPVDLKPLIDAIDKFAEIVDISPGVLKYLADKGFITTEQLQVLLPGQFGSGLATLIRTYAWNAVVWLAGWLGVDVSGKEMKLNTLGTTIAHVVSKSIDITLDVGGVPLYAVVTGGLTGITNLLEPTHAVAIGDP